MKKVYEEELLDVLGKALSHGYSNPNVTPERLSDGQYQTVFRWGSYILDDRWDGGEPFAGITRILRDGRAVWNMVYAGRVVEAYLTDRFHVLNVLKLALRDPHGNLPVRGPARNEYLFHGRRWVYRCEILGDIGEFHAVETIVELVTDERWATERLAYRARILGTFVNDVPTED